jgi:branched-chain amino acid transport system substrate-binding protein
MKTTTRTRLKMDNNHNQNGKRDWLILMIVIWILSLILMACQTGEAALAGTAVDEVPITVGVSLPLSGRRSESGTAAKQGYEVWVAMVNEAGGLLGRPLELKVLDNGSEEKTVVAD